MSEQTPKGAFPYWSGYKVKKRDVLAAGVANWVLNNVASKAYLNFITDLLTMGRAEFEKRLSESQMTSDEFLGDVTPPVSEDHRPKVTRVEVIDSTGRAFVRYYVTEGVNVHMQDDDRTLKIFAGEPKTKEEPTWKA